MKHLIQLLIALSLLCSLTLFAANKPQATKTIVCPPPSALKKNPIKLSWSTSTGFKSYNISFVKTISRFMGAQWNGETIGQITCVYHGTSKTAFPILLAYGTLALEPKTLSWGKNLGGYRNCPSNDPENCAFKIRLKATPINIYKEADELKQN